MRKIDCSFLQPQSKNWSIYKRKILFCEKGIDNFFIDHYFGKIKSLKSRSAGQRLSLGDSQVEALGALEIAN